MRDIGALTDQQLAREIARAHQEMRKADTDAIWRRWSARCEALCVERAVRE